MFCGAWATSMVRSRLVEVVQARFDAVDGVWDSGGVFYDEGVGAPAVDAGGQRCGAVEDRLLCVAEKFAPVVEVDDEYGVGAFFAGKEAEAVGAPPILGELGVGIESFWKGAGMCFEGHCAIQSGVVGRGVSVLISSVWRDLGRDVSGLGP